VCVRIDRPVSDPLVKRVTIVLSLFSVRALRASSRSQTLAGIEQVQCIIENIAIVHFRVTAKHDERISY